MTADFRDGRARTLRRTRERHERERTLAAAGVMSLPFDDVQNEVPALSTRTGTPQPVTADSINGSRHEP
jgi:hypothetical protein